MTDPKNQTNTDTTAELPPVDDYASATEALREKLTDAQTPGYQAEFDPEEAERAGAFVEDALSEEDAADSNADLVDVLGEEQPGFLDDEGPSAKSRPSSRAPMPASGSAWSRARWCPRPSPGTTPRRVDRWP